MMIMENWDRSSFRRCADSLADYFRDTEDVYVDDFAWMIILQPNAPWSSIIMRMC